MMKFTLMLTKTEATALRDLLESISDKGICDKIERRTVEYVLDEINLVYPKKIQNNYSEYDSLCEPLAPVKYSVDEAFNDF